MFVQLPVNYIVNLAVAAVYANGNRGIPIEG